MPTSLILAIAVGAGVSAGVFLGDGVVTPARSLAAACAVVWFAVAARGYIGVARWCFCAAVGAVAVLLAADAEHRALHPPLRQFLEDRIGGFGIEQVDARRDDTPVAIEGWLLADAAALDSGVNLRVHVDRIAAGSCFEPTDGAVSLTVGGVLSAASLEQWRAGRRIRATAVLRRPARYLNAGVADQERTMARKRVSLVGSVKSGALVGVVAPGHAIDEAAAEVRAVVRRAIARHVAPLSAQSAAIAVAILIGDRGSLDPLIEQRLQEAGTYHVIAISGGNIAIVAGLVLGLLWVAGIRDSWAAGGAIAALAAYAYIAGGGASVMRATVMAILYLGLRLIDQRTAAVHAMSLALVAILLATPLAIADVGLWLTFGATVAIVASSVLVPLPSRVWLRAPAALLLASLSAEAMLMPVVAFVFQRMTLAGLAANLVAIPAMAVAQVAATVTVAADASRLPWLAGVLGWVTHAGVVGLLGSGTVVDAAPWLTWRVPSPSALLVVGYYAALFGACLLTTWRRWALVAGVLLFWIAAAPQTWARSFGDGRLHVTAFDVGQGDALLVTLPNGRTLMVDSGGVSTRGDFDIGDRVLGPALRARGIRRLDYLAITHGDPDHIGGAASLVRDFQPREIWYGTYVNQHPPSMQLQSMAVAQRAAWRWLLAGDRVELGGVELRVHHPEPEDWQRQKVRNDDSVVMELRYGQTSVLLTGDIGREVEASLLPSLDLLPTVILKSPHHGSATSSSAEFVEKLRPRVVMISCGRGNPYGHPVPPVMARYRSAGAEILRTDLDGEVEIIIGRGHEIVTRRFTMGSEDHDANPSTTKGRF